ncbi:MAG: hypothetical protein IIC78_06245 [Chloroflexi bacterium]|nr:hypothetical protein [Chloroflexota bacterium]
MVDQQLITGFADGSISISIDRGDSWKSLDPDGEAIDGISAMAAVA